MKHANFLKQTKHVIWLSMPSTRAARQAREHAKHFKLAEHAKHASTRAHRLADSLLMLEKESKSKMFKNPMMQITKTFKLVTKTLEIGVNLVQSQ